MLKMEKGSPYPIQLRKGLKSIVLSSIFSLGVFFMIFIFGSIFVIMFSRLNELMTSGEFFLAAGAVILPFFLGLILLLVIGTISSWLSMKFTSYELGNKNLVFRNGIIARSEKTLPYSKIQHVIIYEGFWQRVLGLSSISIETAGDGGMMMQQSPYRNNLSNQNGMGSNGPFIPNLLRADSIKLRNFIIAKVIKTKSGSGI